MRFVLLSAGPSLSATYHERLGDGAIVIAVNTAAELFLAHWWSCADHERFIEIQTRVRTWPSGTWPRVFGMGPELDKSRGFCPLELARFEPAVTWAEVWDALGINQQWQWWSATSALVLAKWLGAGAEGIDCYGVDMAGTACCAGREMVGVRQAERWGRERTLWGQLSKWLGAEGVPVRVHQPAEVAV